MSNDTASDKMIASNPATLTMREWIEFNSANPLLVDDFARVCKMSVVELRERQDAITVTVWTKGARMLTYLGPDNVIMEILKFEFHVPESKDAAGEASPAKDKDNITPGVATGYWWVVFRAAPEQPAEIVFVENESDDDLFQRMRFARSSEVRSVHSARRVGYLFLEQVQPLRNPRLSLNISQMREG